MNNKPDRLQADELIELYLEKKKKIDALSKEVYLNDLFMFNKDVLQVEKGTDEAGGKRTILQPFHQQLCDFVAKNKCRKKLILMPRGHLKTTCVTVGYSLQRVAKSPNVRILLANATAAMAEAFLGQIKRHLQYNATFKSYFGDFTKGADKWTDSMIRFSLGNASYQSKEANITAYGLGGNLVSQHYDIIIFDDPHNRDNINTRDQIEKVKQSYRDALDLLEPGGEILVVGTRWHDDDLYGWLEDKDNPVSQGYQIFFRQAVDGMKIDRQPKGGYSIAEGKVLWPQKYSKSHLTSLLNDKGLYEFSCQYQNAPVDDESQVFKRMWFKEYDVTELRNRKMLKFTAIDPAISLKERSDFTAIVTIGVDVFKTIYILEIKRGHFSEKQMVDELIYTNEKYRPVTMLIETVAFQKTLQNFIIDETHRRQVHLPINEVMPESSESKEKRIRSLQPYYMRGNILHSRGVANIEYLEDELLRFPKGRNDDTIDALTYAVQSAYPPRKKEKSEVGRKYLY
jgi:predicted phage terminase large subunit-like protein